MTICQNCGAEAEGGNTCPRCGANLPADRSSKALALASGVIGAACALGASAQMIIDYAQHGAFGWSLVGLASCAAAWLLVGFPMLAYRRPALFLPVMGASALVYLWILEKLTGGLWFMPLALPITLAAIASGALSALLCLGARQRGPNLASFILLGGTIACLAIENILSLHFRGAWSFTWSAIVTASALPTAGLLLGIQRRLRQRLG
jgi:hypothetical protein